MGGDRAMNDAGARVEIVHGRENRTQNGANHEFGQPRRVDRCQDVASRAVCHEFRDGPDRIVSCKGGLKSNDVRMTKKAANSDLARNTLNVLQALFAGFFERSFPDGDASV